MDIFKNDKYQKQEARYQSKQYLYEIVKKAEILYDDESLDYFGLLEEAEIEGKKTEDKFWVVPPKIGMLMLIGS